VLAGLAGLAVGAVVVGGVWLVSGTGRTVDRRVITAPARVGEFLHFDQLDISKNPRAAPGVERNRRQAEESTKLLSAAHGGAGALFMGYWSADADRQIIVKAYRDRSESPLFVPYNDAADAGMVKATQTVEQFGDVSCVVRNDPTPQGRTPSPGSVHVVRCARTTNTLTVEITAAGGDFGQPQPLAELVDEFWAQVS
jgi:hypothetical protein